MAQDANGIEQDLEPLRRRFEEFRSTQPLRARLPEALWRAASELAARYGVHATARALRLDYTGLRKRVENRDQPQRMSFFLCQVLPQLWCIEIRVVRAAQASERAEVQSLLGRTSDASASSTD